MALALNPGFVLILIALFVPAAPLRARPILMGLAGFAAAAAALAPPFGEYAAFRQIGLVITPLRLDETSQILGLGCAVAAVLVGIASASRANRFEDCCAMLALGGAAAAAFAGDLVTFVAAAALSMMAAAGLALAGTDGDRRAAALRALGWQAAAGAALLAGIGLAWAASAPIALAPLSATTPAGLALLLGALILVGAPGAHVWMVDTIGRAGPIGAGALAAAAPIPGLVALVRLFPGEPALIGVGAAMALLAPIMALASADLRRAAAYGIIGLTGLCVAAIGAGPGPALAGALACVFVTTLVLAPLAMVAAMNPSGARLDARAAALTAVLGFVAAAGPGGAFYAARSLLSQGVLQEGPGWMVAVSAAATALGVAHFGLKIPFRAAFEPEGERVAAPFAVFLALLAAAFLGLAIGLTPDWLYALLPGPLGHAPFAPERLLAHLQPLTAGLAAAAAAAALGLYPFERRPAPPDLDAAWRGPGRAGVRAAARGLTAIYAGWGALAGRVQAAFHTVWAALARSLDDADQAAIVAGGGAVLLVGVATAFFSLIAS